MKTASKFRKNRRSRTTNKKRGGSMTMVHGVHSAHKKKQNKLSSSAIRKDFQNIKKKIDATEAAEAASKAIEEAKRAKELAEYAKLREENKQKEIKKCKEDMNTLDEWNDEKNGCNDIQEGSKYIDFFKDNVNGQKIAATWDDICPKQETSREFYSNGCGHLGNWDDTEKGKEEAEAKKNKCMNIATEAEFSHKDNKCYNIKLKSGDDDDDDKWPRSVWYDTVKGSEELKALQEGCMSDETMTKIRFEEDLGCDKLGHDWNKSAAKIKIDKDARERAKEKLKNTLFNRVDECLQAVKDYTKNATKPKHPVGKEVYKLIYEKQHPIMASGMSWDHLSIRNRVKRDVDDFVNHQEANEQNKISKYVKGDITYLKHNKHIADLINEKIEKLKETDKKERINELKLALPENNGPKLFDYWTGTVTYTDMSISNSQVDYIGMNDDEKKEIENEVENKFTSKLKELKLELIEETTGGKRKRNRKTKKSKKSKRRTRRRHK